MDDFYCPEYLEPNLNVKINIFILRYIGNWPPDGQLRWAYYLWTVISSTFIVLIYVFVQVSFLIVVWGDFERMISGSFLLMMNIGHCYKMTMILRRQKRIQALLDLMESEIFNHQIIKHKSVFTWYAWNGIFHHVAYQAVGCLATFSWSFASIAHLLSGNVRTLPMDSWYPFDTDKTPLFEIICGHQIIAVVLSCLHNVTMDTLATNLMSVACCQLEILKRNIREINKNEESEEDTHWKLNHCVEHNNTIIDFVNEIQHIFGGAIIYHCFVNCAIICLTAFHITKMNDYVPAEIMGTVMYVVAVIHEIFNFCWHCNELALQSASVGFAAYSSNWWKFNERCKSTLRIIMIRSQRPLIIKAAGILPVSLKTFMSIIQMSYSFFTVLHGSD